MDLYVRMRVRMRVCQYVCVYKYRQNLASPLLGILDAACTVCSFLDAMATAAMNQLMNIHIMYVPS